MIGALLKKERLSQNMSQETLCHGICATSYLSKIETGAAKGTTELLGELFHVLNVTYVTDPTALETLDALYKASFTALRQTDDLPKTDPEAVALCHQLRFSPRGVDACLLCALYDPNQRASLQFNREQLTSEQNLLYAYVKCLYYRSIGEDQQATALLQTVKTTNEGWVYSILAEIYFRIGDYTAAIVEAEHGYQVCATQGNIQGMLDCAMHAGSCYANTQGSERMQYWYSIAKNINHTTKNISLNYTLEYNMGATLLMYGKAEQSIAYFLRAEVAHKHDKVDKDLLYQKMIYALLRVGRPEEAAQRMPLITVIDTPLVLLLAYMLEHPDFMHNKEYCALLEACVQTAKKRRFRGMMDFYSYFLVEAYISTKQYKKAIKHANEFKFSFDIPLFD
ncbi:MAG: helix-turn-helix transcriptional regulator [Clostridiales bacterium]|nr:helix-turn-helix transcriptional regulator [Clostridiales bacterium]